MEVVYSKDKIMIVLDEQGLEMSREEAEKLFVDLGHALQDMDVRNEGKS